VGFASVEIRPHLGNLTTLRGSVPHPLGRIDVDLRREGKALHARVNLPAGITGTFVWKGRSFELRPGENTLEADLTR
jgi:hypothetical protein